MNYGSKNYGKKSKLRMKSKKKSKKKGMFK
jgi:hypothetical protein